MGVPQTLEHQRQRGAADLKAVLTDGGQGHGQELAVADIVKAGHADLVRDAGPEVEERPHQPGGRKIVATDNPIRMFDLQHGVHKGGVVHIAKEHAAGRNRGHLGQRKLVAANPLDNGAGGAFARHKQNPARSLLPQMLCHHVAGAAVVDAHQVERRTGRVALQAAIQKHHRNLGLCKHIDDAPIRGIAIHRELKRSEKHARNLLVDELAAKLLGHRAGVVGVAFAFAGCIAPEQHMRFGEWGTHNALTDRLKDLRGAELGNQQAKLVALRRFWLLNVGPRARTAGHHAVPLQRLDRLGHGDTRGAKALAKLGLGGQAIAGAVHACGNLLHKLAMDGAVQRGRLAVGGDEVLFR